MNQTKQLYILAVGLLVFACKGEVQKEPTSQEAAPSKVIVHEEYTGEEPTESEETEIYKPVPPVVHPTANNGLPSDAIVLFDGSGFDHWIMSRDSSAVVWHLDEDGGMTVKDKTGDIQTKQSFGDIQLHIEWRSPAKVQGEGQSRGNSGVFLSNLYEVQVLDNNDNDTYVNGQVGAVYKQHVPLAMASVPSGEWNTYDIIYRAPEFNVDGQKTKSGTLTVLHNGVLIQDDVEIKGTTPNLGWPKNTAHGKGPLRLQDHGDDSRVSYRNIWIREL